MRLPRTNNTYLMPTVYRLVLASGGLLFVALAVFGNILEPLWLPAGWYRFVYGVGGVFVVHGAVRPQLKRSRTFAAFGALTAGSFRMAQLINVELNVSERASPLIGGFAWMWIGVILASMSAYGWVYHRSKSDPE